MSDLHQFPWDYPWKKDKIELCDERNSGIELEVAELKRKSAETGLPRRQVEPVCDELSALRNENEKLSANLELAGELLDRYKEQIDELECEFSELSDGLDEIESYKRANERLNAEIDSLTVENDRNKELLFKIKGVLDEILRLDAGKGLL